MEQRKFYKYGMWLFLVLNISMITFFFITKPKHPPEIYGNPKLMKDVMVSLNLDENQAEIFSKSAKRHHIMMKEISGKQKQLLKPYFLTISDASNDVNKDSIVIEIQKLEEKKVTETYLHFEEVKALLKPDQQKYFDEFLLQAIGRIIEPN